MILEYCQLLSTAHHVLDKSTEPLLYKKTHQNHPSAKWARASRTNYIWLAQLLKAVCREYTYRYNKTHKSERIGLVCWLASNVPTNIPDVPWTEPTPAMPDQYKVPGDSISSYRNYYNGDKARIATYKQRERPEWFISETAR